jgi:predicted nucleotidyltransferase
MDRLTVVAKLREYEPELRAAGIMRLSLFGSVARGDASAESDVDLIAEFDPARQFSLLDLVGLENRIADILGARVELTPEKALKEPIRERVKREAVLAF